MIVGHLWRLPAKPKKTPIKLHPIKTKKHYIIKELISKVDLTILGCTYSGVALLEFSEFPLQCLIGKGLICSIEYKYNNSFK